MYISCFQIACRSCGEWTSGISDDGMQLLAAFENEHRPECPGGAVIFHQYNLHRWEPDNV